MPNITFPGYKHLSPSSSEPANEVDWVAQSIN